MTPDRMQMTPDRMRELVLELKKKRQAVILAHNYQEGPIQEVADYVADSLKLAQYATKIDEPVILFCGVHFMAETAAMLCPDKTVLVPDLAAGCSLADMVLPAQVRQWKEKHPGGVVVCYINTSAAVKAECDYSCTSANAEQVVRAIPEEKEILFVPDFYLGSYVKAKTGRKIHLWKGFCPSHASIHPEEIDHLRDEHPDAEFLMHPECGCLTKQMDIADKILSTDGMMQYVQKSPARSFIIATDNGILYRMRKENPDKLFLPASENASCHHMQRNTLEKVLRSLVTMQHQVTVKPETARRALVPIDRMMEISKKGTGTLVQLNWLAGTAVLDPDSADIQAQGAGWDDVVLQAANDLS